MKKFIVPVLSTSLVLTIIFSLGSGIDSVMTRAVFFFALSVAVTSYVFIRLEGSTGLLMQKEIENTRLISQRNELIEEREKLTGKLSSFERRLRTMEGIVSLGERILGEPEDVFLPRRILEELVSALDAKHVIFLRPDRDGKLLGLESMIPDQDRIPGPWEVSERTRFAAVKAFLHRKLYRLWEFPSSGLEPLLAADGFTVCHPVFFQKNDIGVIEVSCSRKPDHFELAFLANLSQLLGITIHSAELLRKLKQENRQNEMELRLARELQQSFLPRDVYESSMMKVKFYHRPLREIGGDFYDCFEIAGGKRVVMVGDVSGKGIPAALIAVLVKTWFSGREPEEFGNPAALLQELNRFLTERMDILHYFVAVCIVVIDEEGPNIRFSSAGMEPAAIIDRDGKIIKLFEQSSPPGGMMPETVYDVKSIRLDSGCSFFVYTDGVTDIFHNEEEDDKLGTLFRNASRIEEEDIRTRVVRALESGVGRGIKDDITFAVISLDRKKDSET